MITRVDVSRVPVFYTACSTTARVTCTRVVKNTSKIESSIRNILIIYLIYAKFYNVKFMNSRIYNSELKIFRSTYNI